MPDNNDMQQWPSEDEDFDVTSSAASNGSSDAMHRRQQPSSRTVSVRDESEDQEEQDDAQNQDQLTEPQVQEAQPEDVPEPHQDYQEPIEAAPVNDFDNPEELTEPEPTHYQDVTLPAQAALEAPETSQELQPIENEEQPQHQHSEPVAAAVAPETLKQKKKHAYLHLAIELVLLVALVVVSLYAYSLHTDKKDLKSQVTALNANPQVAVQKQTQEIIDSVGKLMQLPTGETPTIANVTDASQAKQQSAFFDNAQNGDKVLMYVKAGEAILYRPGDNQIVLVAPLTFTNTGTTGASTSTTKK
jgi:hypothetical protein